MVVSTKNTTCGEPERLQGLSLRELEELFDYDSEKGTLTSSGSGKSVGHFHKDGIMVAVRDVHRTLQVRAGPLCYFLHNKKLPEGNITFKDEDPFNLKYSNFVVVGKGRKRSLLTKLPKIRSWIETTERGIMFNAAMNLWSVKRGKKDAVYWCKSLEEALFVRNEWESDKTVQRRDFYQDKYV